MRVRQQLWTLLETDFQNSKGLSFHELFVTVYRVKMSKSCQHSDDLSNSLKVILIGVINC